MYVKCYKFIYESNYPSIFFLLSSRIRVNLLSYEREMTDEREQYNWRAEKNLDWLQPGNPMDSINFFVRSRRIRVDLLSYKSKTTDKQEQYDWRAGNKLDG